MQTPATSSSQNPARIWNVLCHASAFAGFIFPGGFLIGPFLVWLLKKNEFPSVDVNGKEAINFQISCLIYAVVSIFLAMIFVGFFLLLAVLVADFILTIIAAIKAGNDEAFRYPLSIRFIK